MSQPVARCRSYFTQKLKRHRREARNPLTETTRIQHEAQLRVRDAHAATISLTRASLGAPSDRFRWGEAKGRAEGSGQVRRIGEARVHSGCPHQFTGSYLARGVLER